MPGKGRMFYPPWGHFPYTEIDEIKARPELWERSFRELLAIFSKQASVSAPKASAQQVNEFVEQVKRAEALGPYGDEKAEIAVMRQWGVRRAGWFFQQYAPENEGAVSWEQFTENHPRETNSLTIDGLRKPYYSWAANAPAGPQVDQTQTFPVQVAP
jgi:hypothetical protein